MTTNYFCKTIAFTAFFQILTFAAFGQAVFAPKPSAEWHYSFQTDAYEWNIPFRAPRKGILTVNYTKDTLVRGINMKKFEQKETFKYKGNDTLFARTNAPFFMTQRNDSVLLLVQDTLAVAFVYKTSIGSRTKLKVNNGRVLLDLDLQSVGDTTALNNTRFSFRKYTYKTTSNALDVYFEKSLIFLDRIGPVNADLTVINSQGKASNYADTYTLICYKDGEVGELKFANTDCNTPVSVAQTETRLKNFDIIDRNNVFQFEFQNFDNQFVKNIKIYDINGALVWQNVLVDKKDNIICPKDQLPQGLLIVTVSCNQALYKAKKIIIHN